MNRVVNGQPLITLITVGSAFFEKKGRADNEEAGRERERERKKRRKKVKRGIEEESLQVKARGRLAANNDTTNTRVLIVRLCSLHGTHVSVPFAILPGYGKTGRTPPR